MLSSRCLNPIKPSPPSIIYNQKPLLVREQKREEREKGMPTLVSMSSPRVSVTTLTVALVVITCTLGTVASQGQAARAFFVFGDSLADNGNNNHLATTARADSPPYGIDYTTHRPTGRFSNGLNLPDIISEFSHFSTFDLFFLRCTYVS